MGPALHETNDADAAERVWTLIDKIPVSMLATMDGATYRARPMSHRARRYENAIYFLIEADSPKQEDIEAQPHVCLTFADPGGNDFVSLSGSARVLDDSALVRDVWTPRARTWFEGPEDPKLRVLEVTPTEAQYWSGPNMLVSTAIMMAAAVSNLKPYLGDNAKVDLH